MDKAFTAIVLIIVHKKELNQFEKASLAQCYKILGKHPIKLICPRGLDISVYKEINPHAEFDFIDPKWQSNYLMFNRLKIDTLLYEKYNSFEYILFYELDAWVFRDELNYWCSLGYDYIGAPWVNTNLYRWLVYQRYPLNLKVYHTVMGMGKKLSRVGNGGFSLRRTKAILDNLSRFKNAAAAWKVNEDSFFAHYVKTFNPAFKIPDVDVALQFSFDIFPESAFEKNRQLPFGCHAWCRNEPPYEGNLKFWNRIIQM